jgi:phosphatidylglycerol:prolipoprotein diacylglycerol transferase
LRVVLRQTGCTLIMIPYPHINPDMIQIGPLHLRWCGLMYALGFLSSYFLVKRQEKSKPIGLSPRLVQDLILHLAVGLVAGARLGCILFLPVHQFGGFCSGSLGNH